LWTVGIVNHSLDVAVPDLLVTVYLACEGPAPATGGAWRLRTEHPCVPRGASFNADITGTILGGNRTWFRYVGSVARVFHEARVCHQLPPIACSRTLSQSFFSVRATFSGITDLRELQQPGTLTLCGYLNHCAVHSRLTLHRASLGPGPAVGVARAVGTVHVRVRFDRVTENVFPARGLDFVQLDAELIAACHYRLRNALSGSGLDCISSGAAVDKKVLGARIKRRVESIAPRRIKGHEQVPSDDVCL
jgi:hypothetical protein